MPVMRRIRQTEGLALARYGLKGTTYPRDDYEGIHLFPPDQHAEGLKRALNEYPDLIVVDFTSPSAVNRNADMYAGEGAYFAMGTTGGDRTRLSQTVKGSSISAVIAPNMAKEIVAFQAMMQYAAETFPDVFSGYTLEIRESHQSTKPDTSGTARSMTEYFDKLGIPFDQKQIVMVRDPVEQLRMGVPEGDLSGHAWHTYTLRSADGTVLLSFTHNVSGREIYGGGTVDAVRYLSRKRQEGSRSEVFSMIDVLRNR